MEYVLSDPLPTMKANWLLVFLKVKGIDPTNHPIGPELERVKGYFHKIKNAKNPEQQDRTCVVKLLNCRY